MRPYLLLMAVSACARGGMTEPALVDAGGDAPGGDGPPQMIDAPMQSGCTMPFTGTLGRWELTGQAGNQATTAVTMAAPGVTAGALTRSAGLTPVSGASSINSSNWPTAAQLDATKYYTFTLTPPSGCMLALTQVELDVSKSGTGPAMGALATSVDAYAATKPVTTTAAQTVAVTATSAAMIEVRVYGWAATATGGTMRIQNTLTVDGELR